MLHLDLVLNHWFYEMCHFGSPDELTKKKKKKMAQSGHKTGTDRC